MPAFEVDLLPSHYYRPSGPLTLQEFRGSIVDKIGISGADARAEVVARAPVLPKNDTLQQAFPYVVEGAVVSVMVVSVIRGIPASVGCPPADYGCYTDLRHFQNTLDLFRGSTQDVVGALSGSSKKPVDIGDIVRAAVVVGGALEAFSAGARLGIRRVLRRSSDGGGRSE